MRENQTKRLAGYRISGLIAGFCAAIVVSATLTAQAQYSSYPFAESFDYSNGTDLNGQNGWEIYSGGYPHGILPDEFHGWMGRAGGSATAQSSEGQLDGVTLLNKFGDHTGDKEKNFAIVFDYIPPAGTPEPREATTRSRYGNMFGGPRWDGNNPGDYYKMMTCVRWFVKDDGLVSAYDGNILKELSHTPITSRTTIRVDCDYTNRVWSLKIGAVGGEQVVDNFAFYTIAQPSALYNPNYDGGWQDYDGLKQIVFVDGAASETSGLSTRIDDLNITDPEDVPPNVNFLPSVASGTEETPGVSVDVRLSHVFSGTVTVDHSLAADPGTATFGSDYTYSSGSFTFLPGETNKTVNFTILDDSEDEGNETVILALSNVSGGVLGVGSNFHYTIVEDADMYTVPFVEPFDPLELGAVKGQHGWHALYDANVQTNDVFQGDKAAELGGGLKGGYVRHNFTDAQTGVWTDQRIKPQYSTRTQIPPDGSTTCFFVSTNGHVMAYDGTNVVDSGRTVLEGEWSRFTLFSDYASKTWFLIVNGIVSGPYDFYHDTATSFSEIYVAEGETTVSYLDEIGITLTNPLQAVPFVGFAANAASGEESIDPSILLTLDMPHTDTVSVDYYAMPAGTADSPDDYTPVTGTVTFLPYELSKSFTLNIVDDLNWEVSGETIVFGLSNFVGCAQSGITNFTYTITDQDDSWPEVSFASASASGLEETPTFVGDVILSKTALNEASVDHVLVVGGTATEGVDFSYTPGKLVYTPGETNETFSLTIIDDGDTEGDETIILELVNLTNCLDGANMTFTYTIVDSYDTPPVVSYSPSAASGAEGTMTGTVAVTLSHAYGGTVLVDHELAASPGTATSGSDYTYSSDTLTFDPDVTYQEFTFTVTDDTEYEGDETIIFTLGAISNGVAGVQSNFTYTILADPVDVPPTVTYAPATAAGPESTSNVTATVVLSHAYSGTVTVDHLLATPPGDATEGTDYTYSSGSLTFDPFVTTQQFSFVVNDDTEDESDETIVFTLGTISNGVAGVDSNLVYTIQTDPLDVPPTVTFSPISASGPESADGTATVVLSHAYSGTVLVDHLLATPSGTASNGTDYVYGGGTLTFDPLVTNQSFTLTVTDDTEIESDETVAFVLGAISNGVAGVDSNFVYTILADASDNPPTVNFSPVTDSGAEGSVGSGTLFLSHAYGGTVTVEHRLATPSGTATTGDDYTYAAGTVVFDPWVTSQSFTFSIVNDIENEGVETIEFEIWDATNAALGSETNFSFTIPVDSADWGTLPFYETFEDRTPGDLNGQYGWDSSSADVQSGLVYKGVNAGSITNVMGYMKHGFIDEQTNVWTDVRMRVSYNQSAPTPPAGSSVGCYVASSGAVMAYDGAQIVDTGLTAQEGAWTRFTTYSDYATQTWTLYISGVKAGTYDFVNANASFSECWLMGDATSADNLAITTAAPDSLAAPSLIILR